MKTIRDILTNRTIWSAAIAIAASLSVIASTAQADPVLQGYWTFDTDTAENGIVVESSGYQALGTHDGTLFGNGVSFSDISGEPGNHLKSGKYISFSSDSYAVIKNTRISAESATYKNSFDFGGKAFTISCWVKGLPDGGWEPYISKYGENSYGYQVRRQNSNTYPTFTYRRADDDADDPKPNIAGVNTNVNDNQWHNIISVFGGTYREQYLDGQLILRVWNSAADCSGTNEPVVFSGRYNAKSGKYEAFANIALDDVAIYSGALTANQVAYLNNGGDPTNLVAAERSTINIDMISEKGDKSTVLTPSGKTAHSWLNGEAIFYGGPGYLQTNLPVGAAGFNDSFTASAWIYLNTTEVNQAIFGNSTETKNNGLHLMINNGKPYLGFYGNDLGSDQTLDAKTWYYITFQYDAANKTQKIFINGQENVSKENAGAFLGTKTLDIGKTFDGSAKYFDGKMKGISITDGVLTKSEIQAMMNADRSTTRIENFTLGKSTEEWYSGGGSTVGVLYSYQGKKCLHTYYGSSSDETASNVYNQGNKDGMTTILWGPQFTVADNLPEDAAITFSVAGCANALNPDSRSAGNAGVSLWDLTTGDYVRDSSENVLSANGSGAAAWLNGSFSLKGLEGHNLMIIAADRHTTDWGWVALTDLTADITQVTPIANAAQHHLVLNEFNFDKAGDFCGMYEIDENGNRLDSVTHFHNGTLSSGVERIDFYVDESGLAKGKGFLSSGSPTTDSNSSTGHLRSDAFLVQGDILEFLISGGKSNDLHFDLVDADSGDIIYTARAEDVNSFRYDFWNLKELQGRSVYIQLVDQTTDSYGHLELDQIRQIKFAPTESDVAASKNAFKSANLAFKDQLPGFNMEAYSLDGTDIDSLDALANYITGGGNEPDQRHYRFNLNQFTAGPGVGVDVFSTLNVESAGQYTLAVDNDEAYRITLNGDTVFESAGSNGLEFIPLTLSEIGQYALEMIYLDESGEGVSLYLAKGAFDSWNNQFGLLTGFGSGYVNAYGDYFVSSDYVPEPSTWALLVLGAAGMLFWKKRGVKK